MKPSATAGPRRKSRAVSSKHDPSAAKAAGTGSLNGNSAEDVRAHIAVMAFQLYEQRGRRDGYDVEDWLKAEETILSGMS